MQFNDSLPVTNNIACGRAARILNTITILCLAFGLLLLEFDFVAAATPQPLHSPLVTNMSGQDGTAIGSNVENVQLPATSPGAIGLPQLQTCTTYHLTDQTKNVGSAGNRRIALPTPPSAGASTEEIEVTLPLLSGADVEVARFYSDPVLSPDFVHIGDIVGTIWLQTTDFDSTNFTVEVFDYNPANGNTVLLGDLEFKIITDGQNEAALIITSSQVTIPAGHRFLFILYARSPFLTLTPADVTLYYNSINRDSRFTLCQITPPKLTITKHGPAAVVAQNPITYTLTISNSGALAATNLLISDTMPTNATYDSGGTLNGNVVNWSVASLAANSAVEKVFVVKATETITNSNYRVAANDNIFATGQSGVVTVVSQPGQPNLTINLSGPAIADPGDLITYTVTVANDGDTEAENLVVSNTIPVGAMYINGGSKSGDTVTWHAASLAEEASLDFNFVVTAASSVTNDNYLVVADGGNLAVGSKPVSTVIKSKPLEIYLPSIIRGEGLFATLVIESENTGGINPVRILNPDNGNVEVLSCIIGDNVTQLCGTFPAIGNYTIVAKTQTCGVLQGTFSDATPGATISRRIYCN